MIISLQMLEILVRVFQNETKIFWFYETNIMITLNVEIRFEKEFANKYTYINTYK